jgi:hypothetical protein
MAENIPQKTFRQKHLIARLKGALEYLEISVERKYLPSYMIPKRNLFKNKLQKHQQKLVLLKLKFLIQNRFKIVSDFLYNSDTHNAEVSSVRNKIYALAKFGVYSMNTIKAKLVAYYSADH